MRLTACNCKAEYYQRTGRAWWMKVFPGRRLYRCFGCDTLLLLSPQNVVKRLEGGQRSDVQRAFAPTDMQIQEPAGRKTAQLERHA